MDWKKQIAEGMKMIMAGCKNNNSWTNCHDCPFNKFCSVICEEINFSTPNSWEEKGLDC